MATTDDDSFDGRHSSALLSDQEREQLTEDLKRTENEVVTLKQLLAARQKHVSQLKRKLGISPISEITSDVTQGLKTVRDTTAYQKTSEVVTGTADAVRGVIAPALHDIRSSSIFKSFETKIGSAYNTAKMAASTSIDHLAGVATGVPISSNNNAANKSDGSTPGSGSGSSGIH